MAHKDGSWRFSARHDQPIVLGFLLRVITISHIISSAYHSAHGFLHTIEMLHCVIATPHGGK